MTSNPQKALQLLSELSKEYEKNKDPHTAEKIIALVDQELGSGMYSLEDQEQRKIRRAYGVLLLIPYVKQRALANSPFRVYWELKAERNRVRNKEEAKRLDAIYSIDSKSPTQIKAEREAIEKRVYDAVKGDIGYIARSVALADEMLGKAMLSRPIMDVYAQESISSLSHFLEQIAHRVLWIAQCNEKGQLTDDTIDSSDGYVKYLSNQFVSEKMTSQWNPANWPDHLSEKTKAEWTTIYFELEMRNNRFALLDEVLNERIRQITKHDYTEAHDDEHTDGSIADAAAHYASTKDDSGLWPWDAKYDKKGTKSRRDQHIASMAMLLAEVERIDRSQMQQNQ